MNSQLEIWLEELNKNFIFFDGLEINNQATKNEYSYGWSEKDRKNISIQELVAFIQGCSDVVAAKIKVPATFYAWADEQSGHCCFSVITGTSSVLPFGIKIIVSPIVEIAERVNAMDGATYSKSVGNPYLKVWVRKINSNTVAP